MISSIYFNFNINKNKICCFIYMGIEQFYGIVMSPDGINYNNNKSLNDVLKNATHVYIDFKSMIYQASEKIVFQENIDLLEKILTNEVTSDNIDIYKNTKSNNIQDNIIDEIDSYFFKLKEESYNLKLLYIANDGIPEFAKCIEQKQRKTMQNLSERIRNNLNDKNKYESEYHELFENNKFVSYKIMSSKYKYTEVNFMEMVIKSLKNYKTELENYKSRKINVIIDNSDYDEGEVKIINHITNNINLEDNDKILISSPDADVILLSCLVYYNLYKKRNKIYQIDYSNDKGIINIHDFIEKLGDMVTEKNRTHILDIEIAKDLICIFTFLGNDFLPRISSMSNIYKSVPFLIKIYSKIFENQYGKLVNFDGNKHNINYEMFKEYLRTIANEEENLYNEYINPNNNVTRKMYTNYILSNEYFFYKFVQCYNTQFNSSFINCKNMSLISLKYPLNTDYQTKTDLQFNLKKICEKTDVNENKIKYTLSSIQKNLTQYDNEIIFFENKKDMWYDILNVEAPEYDNIENMNYKCNREEIQNYLEGFGYVFNWYFDRMRSVDYNKNISLWFYKKNKKIILINDILDYLDSVPINQEYPFIMEFPFIKKENYFTIPEHKNYILSSFSNISDSELKNFVFSGNIDCKQKIYFEKCYLNISDKNWEETINNLNRKEFTIKYQIFKKYHQQTSNFFPQKLNHPFDKIGGYYELKYKKYREKNFKL